MERYIEKQNSNLSSANTKITNIQNDTGIKVIAVSGSGKSINFNDYKNGFYHIDLVSSTLSNQPDGTTGYNGFMIAFTRLECNFQLAFNGQTAKYRICWYTKWGAWVSLL